jgi:hypothetical protein
MQLLRLASVSRYMRKSIITKDETLLEGYSLYFRLAFLIPRFDVTPILK